MKSTKWNEPMKTELVNLFHLARTALAGPGPGPSRYERKLTAIPRNREKNE